MIKLAFPSREFDEAIAAVCHGSVSEKQARELNELLRIDAAARDEYVLRLELHSRLASEPDLFTQAETEGALAKNILPLQASRRPRTRTTNWILALAAGVTLLTAGWWASQFSHPSERKGTTSKAVAMLHRVVDAQWNQRDEAPRLGAPLEPGWLRLKSGWAQIVFYSGARVVIEGPAELHLISPSEASCRSGKLTAEVPLQARGFRVGTPQMNVTDLGTVFGLDVKDRGTELHVFKGSVEFQLTANTPKQNLQEGSAAVAVSSLPLQFIAANPPAFASLFNLQAKSVAAESRRCNQWRAVSTRLDRDPSMLVRFPFERETDWRLPNTSIRSSASSRSFTPSEKSAALYFRFAPSTSRKNSTGTS